MKMLSSIWCVYSIYIIYIYLAMIQYYRHVHASSKFLWLHIEQKCDVITLSHPHPKCNVMIGNDIVIFFVSRPLVRVAFCICLCLFLHCIKTLLSLIYYFFKPINLRLQNPASAAQFIHILDQRAETCGQTLSGFIFRCLTKQG